MTVFPRLHARHLHPGQALLALLAIVALILSVRLARLLAAPAAPPPAPAAAPLPATDILARFDPFSPATTGGDDAPVTSLALTLHGLRADRTAGGAPGQASGRGSAIIAGEDGVQHVYALGDTVANGVTLAAIAGDHVVLDHGGVRESLWLDMSGEEKVQRYDPLASDPMPPAGDGADGSIAASDAPAPAPAPQENTGGGGAALVPAAPPYQGNRK